LKKATKARNNSLTKLFFLILSASMATKKRRVTIIGGGAAGFFSALVCAEAYPEYEVIILEKSPKLLSKVKVSGGGRCNVTHACFDRKALSQYYPRGGKELSEAFRRFMPQDMIQWLELRGVETKTEADGRMFPVSDDSQTIIDCFLKEAKRLKVDIQVQADVEEITLQKGRGFALQIKSKPTFYTDKIIVASGGSPKSDGFHWLEKLGHKIISPVPSLFTFNIPNSSLKELQGVSVPQVIAKVQGTKLKQEGALLITHWGMSGPAILRLSAWGASILAEKNYDFNVQIQWLPQFTEESIRSELLSIKQDKSNQKIGNFTGLLPKRLWLFLLQKSEIDLDKSWQEISKANINKLTLSLIQDTYHVKGKTTFKEEFVTCGGIDLSDINLQTMESKVVKDLYFAGEVLNIDGITGGFNFQSAWTTGYIAGTSVGNKAELGEWDEI
jgi:predicted Rossmann fold flavoprotein